MALDPRAWDGAHRLAGLELAGAALLELERPDPEVRRHQAERLLRALRDPTVRVWEASVSVLATRWRALGTQRFPGDDAWYLPGRGRC